MQVLHVDCVVLKDHGKGVTTELPDSRAKPRMLHQELKHKEFFASSRQHQPATNFLGQKCIIILRHKEAGQIMTCYGEGPNINYCLTYAESSMDCQQGRLMYSDKFVFSTADVWQFLFTGHKYSITTCNVCQPVRAVVIVSSLLHLKGSII